MEPPSLFVLGALLLENAKRQSENGQKKDGRSEPGELFDQDAMIFVCAEYVEKCSFSCDFLSFVHHHLCVYVYPVQEEAESVCGNVQQSRLLQAGPHHVWTQIPP